MDPDGVEITEEFDEGQQPVALNENFLFSAYNTITSTIESYGWFILLFAIIAYYVYSVFGKKITEAARNRPQKVDENAALAQMERIEAARRRQIAAFEAAKEKFLEEKKLKDQQAAEKKAQDWELHKQGMSQKNNTKGAYDEEELSKLGLSSNNVVKRDKNKPRLRDSDYNPLMGSDGPSCSYRPSCRPGPRGG